MITIRDRILAYLQAHPEGADDDQIAVALGLKQRQQANSRCRQLAAQGVIERRSVDGKIRNHWIGGGKAQAAARIESLVEEDPSSARPWFWEGNVQAQVVAHLKAKGYTILRMANTASKEQGKDIEAQDNGGTLWVTVKGYPNGTPRTRPSTQAGHWFKQAIFDILAWRGESAGVRLGLALPDFPRYRKLAEKVAWLKPVARFTYYWVRSDGSIGVEE
jgi:hypothetical protein